MRIDFKIDFRKEAPVLLSMARKKAEQTVRKRRLIRLNSDDDEFTLRNFTHIFWDLRLK
jgi:hypothetical protein